MTQMVLPPILASLIGLGSMVLGASAALATEIPVCREVPGTVGFIGLEVVPPAPVVGDRVELRFDVQIAVFSINSIRVLGTDAFFAGETSSPFATTFVLDAIQPGDATLRLEVSYGTENYCEFKDGSGFFSLGPNRTVTSQEYPLAVGPSTTPTATATATNTPTPAAVCTPPFCPDGMLVCPDVCPGGCGTICQSAGDLPDLIPSFAEVNLPAIGCIRDISEIPPPETIFCVRNQGTAVATGFDVVLATEPPQRVDGLAAGAQACLTGRFLGSTVSVGADVGDEVTESDETNNVQTFSFSVPTGTPPPFCTATATATPTGQRPLCPGDCDGDGNVSVDELVKGVNISLGTEPLLVCRAMDVSRNGRVTIDELILAVRGNLNGCAAG